MDHFLCGLVRVLWRYWRPDVLNGNKIFYKFDVENSDVQIVMKRGEDKCQYQVKCIINVPKLFLNP